MTGKELSERLLAGLRRVRAAVAENPPSNLYHYTSTTGLFEIFRSSELWITDVRFMNDSTELNYGLELSIKALSAVQSEFPKNVVDLLSVADYLQRIGLESPVFAFCLSEMDDQLGQWRAYGGTPGYSLAFDSAGLREGMISKRECTLSLTKVVYDPTQQQELIRAMIQHGCEALSNTTDQVEKARFEGILAGFIYLMCSSFKHPSFHEEQEWRLAAHSGAEVGSEFRVQKQGLVPYSVLTGKSGLLPIKSITCCPAWHMSLQCAAISRLLKQTPPYSNVTVRESGVPLRA